MVSNYMLDKLLPIKDVKIIKKILVNTKGNLKEQAEN